MCLVELKNAPKPIVSCVQCRRCRPNKTMMDGARVVESVVECVFERVLCVRKRINECTNERGK